MDSLLHKPLKGYSLAQGVDANSGRFAEFITANGIYQFRRERVVRPSAQA